MSSYSYIEDASLVEQDARIAALAQRQVQVTPATCALQQRVWTPRPCYCGLDDCLEQYLCGPAIEREYAAEVGSHHALRLIAEHAANDDRRAVACLARFEDRVVRALANIVNVLDPDAIVLGGGVSNLEGLPEAIESRLSEFVFGGHCTTPVRRAIHGDSSGVRGAAWL